MNDSFSNPDFDETESADLTDEAPENDSFFAPADDLAEQAPQSDELFDDEIPAADDEPAAAEDVPSFDMPEGIYEDVDDAPYEDYYEEPIADEVPEDAPDVALTPAYDIQVAPTIVERPVQEKRSTGRKALRVVGVVCKYLLAIVLALVILVAGLFGYLTVTEYNPAHAETVQPGAISLSKPLSGGSFRVVTFNTGYAGLDETADFFMDGGSDVTPESEKRITENMRGIEAILKSCKADFIFLQEVDTDSKRSYGLNQWLQYEYDLADYETRFAMNYSCDYVPYPLPDTIGKVHSGVATYSRFNISSATRYSLPCPFSWPTRVANLKRCMLVTRIPMDGLEQELVLVNFHLEAYEDGEGRIAQTQMLLDFITEEYEKGNFVIAGGDFNQSFPGTLDTFPIKSTSEWVPGILDDAPEKWQYAYDKIVPTCRLLNQPFNPASNLTQFFVIDGFLVSPNIHIDRVETLDEGFVYSDHNPVVLDFSLNFESQSAEETTQAEETAPTE